MSITVSLIVPVYNGGKFAAGLCRHFAGLHKAIEGIEFIVVNDGYAQRRSQQGAQYRFVQSARGICDVYGSRRQC